MNIDNIEQFYELNYKSLFCDSGRRPLRPTKSYTKDLFACFNKFKKLYLDEGVREHTKTELGEILKVDINTTLQNMRSMQEFGFLTGSVEINENDIDASSKENSKNEIYKLTTSFTNFVDSNKAFGSFLLDKLISIRSLNDFTPYLNLLLCTLREASLYGGAISFGPIGNDAYLKVVKDPGNRQILRDRIYKIYAYCGRRGKTQSVTNDNYLPNISYMSLGTLEELGLLKKDKEKNPFKLNTYSLTIPGEFLLSEINNNICISNDTSNAMNFHQKIYYGAPGTGKSNEISELTGKGKNDIKFEKDYTFRVTFHPDSDYSTFVGAYKPTTYKPEGSSEQKITYDFRPQAFIKAYINAWLHPEKPVALVIEEINRGNCAQVFGDIFQLLDRHKDGLSKYPIEADIDMMGYIARAFRGEIAEFGTEQLSDENKASINLKYQDHYDNAFDKIKNGEILALPTNLSILATMNTSDQSLFPMDSAFKRRWEWIYVPIKNHNNGWKIEVGEFATEDEEGNIKKKRIRVDWWKFLEKINKVIFNLTDSEDKQLGYHFIHLEDGEKIIDNKTFVGKVIFYLWNDVFKDYGYGHDCCKSKDKKEKVSFAKFYKNDSTDLQVDAEVLKVFFEQLDFKDEEFETTPVADNADTPPATPVPADEEGQPEGNAEAENDANETGDVPSAEPSAEPAQEVNDEASNNAAGEASMNPDETAKG